MDELDFIVEPLLEWYEGNKRDLPWRQTRNPYHIWVSEIMLQQTRVEAVKPYYHRFLQTLPTIRDLAEADEEVLLKLWEGLGYYSRVRNMQKAARQMMEQHQGEMPANHAALLRLTGIGPYTAGAIASIAFGLPFPAVDGNVLRVMSRVTADLADISLAATKKEWERCLAEIMPQGRAGEWNQALMEIGATVCLPNGQPKCDICPLRRACRAYAKGQVQRFPVKAEKKARKKEYLNVFFCVQGDSIAIAKRPAQGLLSNLWELPNAPQELAVPIQLQQWGILEAEFHPMPSQKHIFTHVEWWMDCYYVKVLRRAETELLFLPRMEIEEAYALPSAFRGAWQEGIKRMEEFA